MKNADKPIHPITLEGYPLSPSVLGTGNLSGLTAREIFCLHAGIPETEDPDLDDIIRKSERKKLATAAMQGICANRWKMEHGYYTEEMVAKMAIYQADALLTELEKQKK